MTSDITEFNNQTKLMKPRSNFLPIKVNELIRISGAVAGIIMANPFATYASPPAPAPSASPVITWTATGKQSEKNVDVLFVQNAKNVSFSEGELVLRRVNSVTVCFTDRPARMAGHMQTSQFVPLWSQGKDSFVKDNPNATLSVFSGNKVSDLVVELSNPRLSGDDLAYDTRILEGTPPAEGGSCALFIDVIGMPATPMSYAGVARRVYRR